MMRFVVVAVRDRQAEVFGQPVFAVSVGTAIRSFSDEVNRVSPDNALNKHPEDYDLYQLGVFHDTNGRLERMEDDLPLLLLTGSAALIR